MAAARPPFLEAGEPVSPAFHPEATLRLYRLRPPPRGSANWTRFNGVRRASKTRAEGICSSLLLVAVAQFLHMKLANILVWPLASLVSAHVSLGSLKDLTVEHSPGCDVQAGAGEVERTSWTSNARCQHEDCWGHASWRHYFAKCPGCHNTVQDLVVTHPCHLHKPKN
ncbi:hypothetical protein PCASD_16474 [Puccinia coronata f. sp. avenae]|uniref:Uncharacterized protein n=1 Tax=Puccinia coronata f. sp. avenae TaxID=200324 RepID=A0A2N5TXG8_9BASI|nr:hypothetical protein PCASD_16474 [Puccinia coronata f. sp. avenae]